MSRGVFQKEGLTNTDIKCELAADNWTRAVGYKIVVKITSVNHMLVNLELCMFTPNLYDIRVEAMSENIVFQRGKNNEITKMLKSFIGY